MLVSKVSVIIPHWNGIDILADCLESLKKNTYPNIEIIVVDNASTDGSSEWISSHYPDIKLIRNNKNYGYAGGCNKGAEASSGEYLTFLNNDTIQNEDFIEHLADFLNLNSHLSILLKQIIE